MQTGGAVIQQLTYINTSNMLILFCEEGENEASLHLFTVPMLAVAS